MSSAKVGLPRRLREAQGVLADVALAGFGLDAPGRDGPDASARLAALFAVTPSGEHDVHLVIGHLERALEAHLAGDGAASAAALSRAAAMLRDCQRRVDGFAVLDHSAGCACCLGRPVHPITA